jgi:hypothetical protein
MAFSAESGFHEIPQESGRPLGFAERRARHQAVECREHLIMRYLAGCLRLRLFAEIWLRGHFRPSPPFGSLHPTRFFCGMQGQHGQ